MFKKLIGIALLSGLFASIAFANEASLKKSIEAAYPKFTVDSVTKTPFPGLYEVFMGGQILYTDEKMNFLIAEGRLVDPKTRQDLTADRLEELTRIDFSKLPLNEAIKVVKGNGKRQLVVFSDVDCPYCKRLERDELSQIDDVTIYTFLYPIAQLHPDAAEKSKSIWCAKKRVQAWNNWILKDQLPPAVRNCDAPLEKVGDLARQLGIVSTPTLVFADGKRMLGAQSYKLIEDSMIKAANQ